MCLYHVVLWFISSIDIHGVHQRTGCNFHDSVFHTSRHACMRVKHKTVGVGGLAQWYNALVSINVVTLRQAWMGDRLWAGKLSRYVTSHPGQLSLAIPLWEGAMSTSLGWEGNCRFGVALAMRHRQQWFIHTGSTAKGAEHPAFGVCPSFIFIFFTLHEEQMSNKSSGEHEGTEAVKTVISSSTA